MTQERLFICLLEYLQHVVAICEDYVKRLVVFVRGTRDLARPVEQTVQVTRSYPLRLCLFYQHSNASAKQKLTPNIHLQELSDGSTAQTFDREFSLCDDLKLR